ncbi:MAG: 2-5 ligase [Planctomycetaceae bacterium]|nr:2-5 ligase [Planctomycetaceae bacterium]
MARLFVAIELPADTIVVLSRIQPRPTPGLRIAKPQQMHLTLHFIGDADIDPIVKALTMVKGRPFELQIERVGRFPPQGRASTLWAGVQANAELLVLHAAIGASLATTGFKPESRPFAPHITLARCSDKVRSNVVDEFLSEHDGFTLPPILITGFALFSSTMNDDGPVYRREGWFPI